MKAIIIGAGISGLTAAHGLRQAGLEVVIYDKASQLRDIGGGILIWPHGLRYLEWMDLADALTPFYTSIRGCKIVGIDGHEIVDADYKELYQLLGGEILPIERSLFQKILQHSLVDNHVHLNKQCVDIENNIESVRVLFADGTSDQADLLIAADGVHSNIRHLLFPQVTEEYTGTCWWGGITEQKHASHFPIDKVYFALGEGKICIVWPTSGNRLLWYIPVKMAEQDLREDSQQQLEQICADWHPEIKSLISASEQHNRFGLPIYSVSNTTLQKNRVVLIGDAAQTLGPLLAQGASRAIEDAYALANCIFTHQADISTALAYYELMRLRKYQRLFELEQQTTSLMLNDNLIALQNLEKQMQQVDLVSMYQELIPLVNEQACYDVAYLSKQPSCIPNPCVPAE